MSLGGKADTDIWQPKRHLHPFSLAIPLHEGWRRNDSFSQRTLKLGVTECPGLSQGSEFCWVRRSGFFNTFLVLIKRDTNVPNTPLLTLPSSYLEHSRVAGPATNHNNLANQDDPRRGVKPRNQLQHSPTSDLPVIRGKKTPSWFKPPESGFLQSADEHNPNWQKEILSIFFWPNLQRRR